MSNSHLTRTVTVFVGTALNLSFFLGIARAQNPAPPSTGVASTAQSETEEKPQGFLARTIKFTGQARARWEATQGANFTTTPADSYVATRVRLGVAFKPASWLRFFAETQDSRVLFYKVKPTSSVSDPFDWRQGYVEAGVLEGNGANVRVGRQELQLGSGRLVGTGDYGNVTKPYNVALGTITFGSFATQLVAGSQILIDPNRMDRDKPGEHFYADYTAFKKLIPGASVEPYFMAKTALNVKGKDGVLGNADTLYLGGRVIGKLLGGVDYNVEGVREAGSYADDTVRAWGYVGGGGWTNGRLPWKLHFSSDFMYASGDSGIKDGRHESFDFLYGLQQPLASLTGLFSWRNTENWRAGVDFSPVKKLQLKVSYRDYWLATVTDGLYNSAGTQTVLNKLATSNHVGEGVDAQAVLVLSGKMNFGIGVGNLDPGSYLRQSGKTSGFVYPYLNFTRQL
jgi:hypothetical protein